MYLVVFFFEALNFLVESFGLVVLNQNKIYPTTLLYALNTRYNTFCQIILNVLFKILP